MQEKLDFRKKNLSKQSREPTRAHGLPQCKNFFFVVVALGEVWKLFNGKLNCWGKSGHPPFAEKTWIKIGLMMTMMVSMLFCFLFWRHLWVWQVVTPRVSLSSTRALWQVWQFNLGCIVGRRELSEQLSALTQLRIHKKCVNKHDKN